MYVLDNELLYNTTIASLLIIFGVVLLNTVTTLEKNLNLNNINDKQWHFLAIIFGAMMFMVGWLQIANLVSMNKDDTEATILYYCSIAIMVSAGAMKYMMYNNKMAFPFIPLFPLTFILSWIALGMLVGGVKINDLVNIVNGNLNINDMNIKKKISMLIGPLVIGSMMVALPWERKNNVSDGPGMPMFVIAWCLLVFLNSTHVIVTPKNEQPEPLNPVNNNLTKAELEAIFNTIVDKKQINKIAQLDFNAS